LNNSVLLFVPLILLLNLFPQKTGWAALSMHTNTTTEFSTPDSTDITSSKNLYFDDYSDKLAISLYAKQKFSRFIILDKKIKKELVYSPNGQLNLGVGFNYKWLGLGLAFNFGFVNNDNEKYGKTKRLDWQTNIYMKRLVVDFYLQYYKGFYIRNSDEIFPNIPAGEYYIRPDIASVSLGIGGLYVFNHKRFSYKSAFLQTAIQKRSAGSFLLGAQIFTQGLRADSSFFPSESIFGELPETRKHTATYMGFSVAYAYNFIVRQQYFASLSLLANIKLGYASTVLVDGTRYSGTIPVFHFQPRFAMGVNKPKWYAGVSLVNNIYSELNDQKDQQWAFTFSSGNYRIFLGWRFNVHKRHKKSPQ